MVSINGKCERKNNAKEKKYKERDMAPEKKYIFSVI